jgi:hypothetical protein|tara:strand:- start:581 stop:829 length:249 start_codon:yes stop_codon:yes gene_type:complete
MAYTKMMAFKEAVGDTAFAFCINVPLNFILVALAFRWEFSAFQTSVMLTSIFTVFAIVRKTYVRLYFNHKNLKKEAKLASTT